MSEDRVATTTTVMRLLEMKEGGGLTDGDRSAFVFVCSTPIDEWSRRTAVTTCRLTKKRPAPPVIAAKTAKDFGQENPR